jgi:hypothetical protein
VKAEWSFASKELEVDQEAASEGLEATEPVDDTEHQRESADTVEAAPEPNADAAPVKPPVYASLLATITKKDWIVDVQPTPPQYRGAEGVVNYLAGYISGTAIGDGRIVSNSGTHVTIRIKDYKHNRPGTQVMPGEEFVRRYTDHILPKGIFRVRYVGLFGPSNRQEKLTASRKLLLEHYEATSVTYPVRLSDSESETSEEDLCSSNCRHCKAKMKLAGRIKPSVMQDIMVVCAKMLILLLEASLLTDETYQDRLDRLLLANRRSLGSLSYNHEALACLKLFVLQELDKELDRREAELAKDCPIPEPHPPPPITAGATDAA